MKKNILIINVLIVISFYSCCRQKNSYEIIEVEAYSSYNDSYLPKFLSVMNQKTNYDSTINTTLGLIGLPNTDIEIETTKEYGAFSVINRLSQRRFFVYNPTFFDSVYSVSNTNYAIMSICFHELAHQIYRHPLKPTFASHIYEKQADRYSGYQMCIIGATLEQSLIAMKKFGNNLETNTHPDKATRLTEIKKGYIDAKIKIFKDSTYLNEDSIFKANELLLARLGTRSKLRIERLESLSKSEKAYNKKVVKDLNPKQFYSLYGELIYLTSDKEIKLLSNNETIGNLIQPINNSSSKIIDLDGVKFYLEDERNIYSINPDGSRLEVGNKIIY